MDRSRSKGGSRLSLRKDCNSRPKRLKTRHNEEVNCPTCGLTLRLQKVESHLEQEITKLYKLPQSRPPSQRPDPNTQYSSSQPDLWGPGNPTNDDTTCSNTLGGSNSSSTHGSLASNERVNPKSSLPEDNSLLPSTGTSVRTLEEEMNSSSSETTSDDEARVHYSPSDHSESASSTSSSTSWPSFSGEVHRRSGRGRGVAAVEECKRRTAEQLKRAEQMRAMRAGRAARHRKQQQRLLEVQERTCPHCGAVLQRDDILEHIDNCQEVEDDSSDQEEGNLPEYHWCGQTRVRVTDLLRSQGQLHALGTVVQRGPEDDEVDVCNDDDDFGPQQFFEPDAETTPTLEDGNHEAASVDNRSIDLNSSDAVTEESSRLSRNHLTSTSDDTFPRISFENMTVEKLNSHLDCRRVCNGSNFISDTAGSSSGVESGRLPTTSQEKSCISNCQTDEASNRPSCSLRPVVDSLIEKVKKLELEVSNSRSSASRCSVCRDEFDEPLVSISCWHVHCRQCWMSTLVNKRQCPQCLAIFSLTDLRRIYL